MSESFDAEVTRIADWMAGACSPGEAERVERWVAEDPERMRTVERLREVRAEMRADNPKRVARLRSEAMCRAGKAQREQGIAHGVGAPGVGNAGGEHVYGRQGKGGVGSQALRRGMWFTLVGAMLTAIIVIGGWNAITMGFRGHQAALVSTYVTGNAQRATITLPDGNTVTLNVASRLDVPADYTADNHTVRLVGEGLFTITHHDGRPFSVLAGPTAARVLGTRFAVRHYATDTATTVAVGEGKVAVRSLVVTAAHQVHINRAGIATVQHIDPANFSFARGTLMLNGELLPDAIPELDRWYDVDIRLGDAALKNQRINAILTTGSLSDLTGILESVFNVRVVRNGRIITLFSR